MFHPTSELSKKKFKFVYFVAACANVDRLSKHVDIQQREFRRVFTVLTQVRARQAVFNACFDTGALGAEADKNAFFGMEEARKTCAGGREPSAHARGLV